MSRKILIEHECPKCKKIFYTANWNKKIFCSRVCEGSAKIPLPLKYCILCKNQIKISPKGNITYFMKRRFCSAHCRGIYITKDKKGKNSPNWKGEAILNKSLRSRFRNNLQKEILKRDNYTCQLCGRKENLQVDHIQPWAEYVELRFSINNCRTVCAECHYQITFDKPMPKNMKGWGQQILERRKLK